MHVCVQVRQVTRSLASADVPGGQHHPGPDQNMRALGGILVVSLAAVLASRGNKARPLGGQLELRGKWRPSEGRSLHSGGSG